MSRDIYRLARRFDFFRMLSCYFTTIGFYFNSLVIIFIHTTFIVWQLELLNQQKDFVSDSTSWLSTG